MKKDYLYLIGKTRQEVIADLGFEYNYHHASFWTYHLKTNWLWRKTFLIIYFKDDVVKHIAIEKIYGELKIKNKINL